ncbi:MAG: hypothetical protein HY744_20255 [Deltaproteobacteria bacterium]|nr:hypothetical protein [Deltaproteobacteria bacterium]
MDEEIARRALGGEELALRLSKKEQFGAEAERQLETLGEKYRLRLRLQPFALLLAQLPVSICELLVRRRKDERRLEVAYNLLAKRFDPLPCEACGRDTHAFGLCDQALHVLCGPCLDRSGGRGRRDCPRCLGRRPPANVGELIARPPAATQEETGP